MHGLRLFVSTNTGTGITMSWSWFDEHIRNINPLLEAMPAWKRRVLGSVLRPAQDNAPAVLSVGDTTADNTLRANVEPGGIRRFEMNEQLI